MGSTALFLLATSVAVTALVSVAFLLYKNELGRACDAAGPAGIFWWGTKRRFEQQFAAFSPLRAWPPITWSRSPIRVTAMLIRKTMPRLVGPLLVAGLMCSASAYTKEEHKLTLRAIMSELGTEYLRLTNALLIDDFKGLEESAKAIEGHPLPDEIVAAIKNRLGKSFHGFERIDEQSHQAAANLAARAAAKDIIGAAKAFGSLAESCVSCHKRFRATLRPLSD